MKDKGATWYCGIDLLVQTPKANAALFELLNGINQMLERASEAIEAPHHQGITYTDPLEGFFGN